MKDMVAWFLGADLLSTITYYLLQAHLSEYVIDNSMKVAAALFVGFIGGFMGVLGKKVGEDYIRQRKAKHDERLKRKDDKRKR